MKWFFSILILINLGLFLLIYPQQKDVEISPVMTDVGELRLASELQQNTMVDETNSVKDDEAVQAMDGTAELATEQAKSDEPPIVQTQEQAVVEPVVEVLSQSEDVPVDPQTVAIPEFAPRCAMVGYVETRSAAEKISVRLRVMGLKPELQSETRNEQAGYWVLIPQQSTRREAVNIAKRLEESGVSDLWRFTSGELVHAISLGLFRDEVRAGDRKREIDALGFNSVVQPRYREKTKYWLSYQANDPAIISDQDWSDLVNDFPELVSKAIECR
ncbi:MAG: hypothetical protein ABW170_07210 [Candidatus Thiodiazotropha sp. L084R]